MKLLSSCIKNPGLHEKSQEILLNKVGKWNLTPTQPIIDLVINMDIHGLMSVLWHDTDSFFFFFCGVFRSFITQGYLRYLF